MKMNIYEYKRIIDFCKKNNISYEIKENIIFCKNYKFEIKGNQLNIYNGDKIIKPIYKIYVNNKEIAEYNEVHPIDVFAKYDKERRNGRKINKVKIKRVYYIDGYKFETTIYKN